jgi:hypothetical protein
MLRRLKWILVLVVVVLVAGAGIAILTTRPGLSDARDKVDGRWADLRSTLVPRYTALGGVEQALVAAGGPDRAVTRDLRAALAKWRALSGSSLANADAGSEASTADDLEALARRARANMVTGRLNGNAALAAALAAFDKQIPVNPRLVPAYNAAVRSYQHARSGTIHAAVASLLGYDERPQLLLGS